MTQHQLDGEGYYNRHPYNNKESRWCDLNEVPYARNGYLYGSETIEDQITGITYYPIQPTVLNNSKFNQAMYDGTLDPTSLFQEGDTLLIRHQQADVRFKITEFSPRAKNMVGTRYLNVAWHWNQEAWDKYKKEHFDEATDWMAWQDRSAFWTTGSVLASAQPDKIARPWSWQAVTKETFLKLQLLGYV